MGDALPDQLHIPLNVGKWENQLKTFYLRVNVALTIVTVFNRV
jgi:hypothetical protein